MESFNRRASRRKSRERSRLLSPRCPTVRTFRLLSHTYRPLSHAFLLSLYHHHLTHSSPSLFVVLLVNRSTIELRHITCYWAVSALPAVKVFIVSFFLMLIFLLYDDYDSSTHATTTATRSTPPISTTTVTRDTLVIFLCCFFLCHADFSSLRWLWYCSTTS